MFRIFRNLRNEKVLKRSKSYFLYAVGEIILVVIGILIALYLNTQKEEFKERQNEIVLLEKLKEENLYNIDLLKDNEDYHKKVPEMFYSLVDYLSENKLDSITDSLGYYLNETMKTPAYSFSQGNLNNYIVSQKNNFPEINREVIYLKNLQDDLNIISKKSVDLKLEDFYKFINSDLDFYTGEIYSTKTINSVAFRNNIFLMQSVEEELARIFDLTIGQMRKVDSLLVKTLEKN